MTLPNSHTRSINPAGSISRQLGRGRMVVMHGEDRGESFLIQTGTLILGSGEDCQLQLTDPTVSRRHMEISVNGSGLLLRDLGSTNGSFVNGARFRELELGYGTEIQVGQTVLKYVPDEEAIELAPGDKENFGGLFGRDQKMRRMFSLRRSLDMVSGIV